MTACAGSDDDSGDSGDSGGLSGADPGDCITVDMAVSSEKIALLTELAEEFNDSDDAELDEGCVFVRPYSKASGGAAQLIVEGWPNPEANGTRPVIWSPAASGWAGIVNERAGAELAPAGTPFMLTPLVIAMPQPMAEALGWPDTPIGFADIVELANDPEGWASLGHPEWGPFRLGKTNPNFSTSGLNFTIAEYYAATGKSRGLTTEDLNRPEVIEFAENVESAVVHYGDITMTFLNNWFATDVRGTSLTYASAVAVEEKSVIDYNLGNPDGVLQAGETAREPRVPLVAIYPSEGTLFSDNPFIILDTEWVTPEQKIAAAAFEEYVQRPENQAKVLEFGFRPNNPNVPLADPVSAANGVDPNQPTAELEVPSPEVTVRILDAWAEQRKEARVLLVLDISGSMGELATDNETKLDLAKQAAVTALDQFKDADEVGLWVFSTDLGGDDPNYREAVPSRADRRGPCPARGTDPRPVPHERHAAVRRHVEVVRGNARDLRPGEDQRHRVAHRRRQRRRQPRRRRRGVRRTHRPAAIGQRRRQLATGARVHDLLRRRRRRGDAAGHRPSDVGRPLRRIEPGHDPAGVHGRHLQLLERQLSQPWPDPASAIASSPRRSRAPSCRRSASCCSVPRRPGRS